jgi:hypothetical protein
VLVDGGQNCILIFESPPGMKDGFSSFIPPLVVQCTLEDGVIICLSHKRKRIGKEEKVGGGRILTYCDLVT